MTVLTAYAAYIGAEALHASGILAAVVTGIYTGYRVPRELDADTRLTGVAFWRVMVFALEITLFVLLGLQLPTIVDTLNRSSSGVADMLGPAAAIAVASILVRMAFVFLMGTDIGETLRERFIVGWSGMRGAVSLAAALAVPLAVPDRPQIIFLTFALILATLVGQGLTLPWLIRLLELPEERRWSEEEAAARMEAAQAALDRIDEIEGENAATEKQLERLRDHYRRLFRTCMAVLGGEDSGAAQRAERLIDYGKLRSDLIDVERDTLRDLRSHGRLRDQTRRQIERDLDLEQARIRV
jgi:CPA1 family monovalent cation:H+ antiporter